MTTQTTHQDIPIMRSQQQNNASYMIVIAVMLLAGLFQLITEAIASPTSQATLVHQSIMVDGQTRSLTALLHSVGPRQTNRNPSRL
ncbi:MAG: hypothetical protein HQL54_07930 [Magnetococcales bacterium]|nr:hypothetical protein [Magnetococcales bacterium]